MRYADGAALPSVRRCAQITDILYDEELPEGLQTGYVMLAKYQNETTG